MGMSPSATPSTLCQNSIPFFSVLRCRVFHFSTYARFGGFGSCNWRFKLEREPADGVRVQHGVCPETGNEQQISSFLHTLQ